jgi:hypothetical protein
MKNDSWVRLIKPIEITEDVMEQLFGSIKGVKQVKSGNWTYKFENLEIEGKDLGKSRIKIIKFRLLKKKRKL